MCVAMYACKNEAEARAKRHSRGAIQRRTFLNSANKDSQRVGKNKKMGVASVAARFALATSIEFSKFLYYAGLRGRKDINRNPIT